MSDAGTPTGPTGPTGGAADPFRPFRSRRGRVVATTLAVVSLVIFGGLAVFLPGSTPTDSTLIVVLGVAIAFVCYRYATISAVPDRGGLVVRNLVTTRRLAWAQVLRVTFDDGAPWVTLELDDTEQVAVMAVQRADGPSSRDEAGRLAALVQALGEARPSRGS